MTESCVQEIKLTHPKLKSFIREVENKHGEILSLSELYAREQKQGNEIILGVVDTVLPVIKKRDRQLQIIRLFEVTIQCHRGQLFRVCAFNKFATSLADTCLRKGDFAAFCSASIWETSQYRIEKGCHHLEAHIGLPEQPSAKIFFARKPHITNAGTSKQQGSSAICKSLGVSLEQCETPRTVRGTTSCFSRTSHNSAIIHTSILSCTSSSRGEQIQHALDDSALALRSTRNKCMYKKLSDLVEPERKVNIYGVIHAIVKMPKEDNKHSVVKLKDETCGPDEEFRVYIFFNCDMAFPRLEHGYILRLHGLKTRLSDGVLDGCVFRATDVVTFPPDDQGIASAFATSKCFHFTDSDAKRLAELRRWIASQKQQQPWPTLHVTSHTTLVRPVLRSEPNRTLLSEIKKEGNYVLHCKVLDVNVLSDEIRFITVTDGTFFMCDIHLDEDERHAIHEVRIVVVYPSPLLKKIRRGSLVEVTNVTVQLNMAPTSSLCNWPYLSLKMNGNNCSVKIFKGFESEAVKLKRQLQDARLRGQQRPTDSVYQIIKELIYESPSQSDSDNNVQVADTVTHSSVQSDCQQSKMSAHLFNYNSDPVQQYVVSSGGETSLQSEDEQCSPSLLRAEEEPNCQSLQKSVQRVLTNVQQLCLSKQCVFTGNVKQKGDNRDDVLLSRKNMQQDILAGNGNCVQEMAEEVGETYTEFADGVAAGSNAWDCTSTLSIGDQNMNAVNNIECMGDAEMHEVESLSSEILAASEMDDPDSTVEFPALTQAYLRDTGISYYHEAEASVTLDDFCDASTVSNSSHDSVPTRVTLDDFCDASTVSNSSHDSVPTRVTLDDFCDASTVSNSSHDSSPTRVQRSCEDGGSSQSTAVACTDEEEEDMECHSAELRSSNIGCKQKFASGILSGIQGIPAYISHIKTTRLPDGAQQVYLLKAWLKDIEPPITRDSKMNIVSGFCDYCKYTQSYESLKMHKNQLLCQYCFQKGQKSSVVLEYLLRLHLIDKNDDELIVTVSADRGAELLGCTVNAYLYDNVANRRVTKILTGLIARGNNASLQDRGPMLKLMVTPVHTSMGTEYIVHNTYLYTTNN